MYSSKFCWKMSIKKKLLPIIVIIIIVITIIIIIIKKISTITTTISVITMKYHILRRLTHVTHVITHHDGGEAVVVAAQIGNTHGVWKHKKTAFRHIDKGITITCIECCTRYFNASHSFFNLVSTYTWSKISLTYAQSYKCIVN